MEEKVFEIPQIKIPKIPIRTVGIVVVAIVGLVLATTSFYQVQPQEVGVVQRFGAYIKTTQPGLNFKLPFIDSVRLVPVQRQLREEFGFRGATPGSRRARSGKVPEESLMLTGDLNVAVVEWIVQYRVADPYKYLFQVRNVEDTFRDMSETIVRQVVGDRTVTEVVTVGREEIGARVKDLLQDLCDQYETGILVDQVVLQDVKPPDAVKPSWDAVNQAEQQRDRLLNQAQTEYNTVIPRAKGEKDQLVLQAQGYATNRVNRSEGDASRFKALSSAYKRAPEVTRRRMYLETMEKVLPQAGAKLFLDEKAKGVLPLLPLDTLKKIPGVPTREGGGQ